MLTQTSFLKSGRWAVVAGAVLAASWIVPAVASELYWTNYDYEGADRFSLHRLQVAGAHPGGPPQEVIHTLGEQPAYARLTVQGEKIYWSTLSGAWRQVQRDGTQMGSAQGYDTSTAFRLAGAELDRHEVFSYWPYANPGVIRRGDFEGENQEDLIDTRRFEPNLSIALDERRGKIYWAGAWSGDDTGLIQRANLDGTEVETLIGSGLFMDDYPVDLVLDSRHRKIYWTNLGQGKIQRANLDGSQVEDVVTDVRPFSIALDELGGRRYRRFGHAWGRPSDTMSRGAVVVPEPAAGLLWALSGWGMLLVRRGLAARAWQA